MKIQTTDIQNTNNIKNTKPLVSIDCLAFNHEAYIRDALEGFLMQKTDFTFEVLIHDDASTDKTANIIRKYEKKYPGIIKPIYQKENQYTKGIDIPKQFQYPRATGKYIAICEGDDYWIDPQKLQKQVDFLEAHSDYGLVYSNFDKLYEKTGRIIRNANIHNKIYNSSKIKIFNGLLTKQCRIATLTVLARTELLSEAINNFDMLGYMMGDLPTWLEMAQLTKFHYFKESFGVYRKVEGSASNNKNTNIDFQKSAARIRLEFANKYSAPIEIKNNLQRAYSKMMLLKAFYSGDKQLSSHYFNYMEERNLVINLFDKLIYLSINNKTLYTLFLSFDKINKMIVFTINFILRKNI